MAGEVWFVEMDTVGKPGDGVHLRRDAKRIIKVLNVKLAILI